MRTIARGLAAAAIMLFTVVVAGLGAGPAWAGGGCHGPLTDAAGVHVEISALCYSPTVLRIRPGTTVTWVNHDGMEHTVTATGDAFDGDLQDGQTYSQRFPASGVYPYYCHFHPGMVGVVFVGDGHVAATVAAPAAPAAHARSSHPSGWRDVTIGALAVVTALVALGAWRSFSIGRRTARTGLADTTTQRAAT
jgi:plastocyanin